MVKRFIMVTLAFLMIGVQAFAQSMITGKVVDTKGDPVAAAGIQIKGTNIGVITDLDGIFSIKAASGDVLVVSSIGYKTTNVAISNQTNINIVVEDDALLLDDVVVVAYGTARKKDLTGSITAVDGRNIDAQAQGTITRALEGQVAGLQISALDGQPGLDVGIRIRGISTVDPNSANALIIIDGTPAIEGVNPLSSLNSKDIASITVLKDAASTAMYGARGANGVILITTKSGKAGKTKISFEGRWGINTLGGNATINRIGAKNPAEQYEFVWESIYNAAYYGFAKNGDALKGNDAASREFASAHLFNYTGDATGGFQRNALGNWMVYDLPGMTVTPSGSGVSASGTMSGAYLVGTDGKINPDARLMWSDGNAYDVLYTDRFRQEYNISASGGNEKVDYHISVGMLQDPSYIRQSGFDRYTARANVNAMITDWLKVGAKFGYTNRTIRSMATRWGRNPGAATQNIFYWINETNPLVQVYARDEKGNYVEGPDGKAVQMAYNAAGMAPNTANTPSVFGYTSALSSTNLIKFPQQSFDNQTWQDLNTKGYVRASFLKYFSAEVNLAYDTTFGRRVRFYNIESAPFLDGTGHGGSSIFRSQQEYSNMTTQQLLNYNHNVDKIHVDAVLGHEFFEYNYNGLQYASGSTLLNDVLAFPNFLGTAKYSTFGGPNTGGIDKEALESYFGRANFIYDDKYYLSASVRRDGSSKFKYSENRWGTFWSIGAGWRISSEGFMEATKSWLDNFKVRASYGVIGNQNGVGRYSGYQTWSYGSAKWAGSGLSTYPENISLTKGGWVNDGLTWEKTRTTDAGVDFTLFGGKFAGTFDWFNKHTINAIDNQNASYLAAGQSSLKTNTTGIRSRGFEIELSYQPVKTKDWDVILSTNGTHYNTVLLKAPLGNPETWEASASSWSISGSGSSSGKEYLRGEGKDWYNLYLYKYGGVAGNSGKTFYDNNNDKQTGYVENNDAMGMPLFWHRVTKDDVKAGTFAGAVEGDDILTTKSAFASKYEVGDAIPEWIGGFTSSVRYRNFDLTVMLAYQLGGKFYSVEYGDGQYRGSSNVGYSVSRELFGNTWSETNREAKFPKVVYGRNYDDGATFGSWLYTDMALFSASYLSVKNITIGYTLPEKIVKKANISSLRLFASADNTILLHGHSGVDPRWSLVGGMEVGAAAYPTLGVYSFGVDINF